MAKSERPVTALPGVYASGIASGIKANGRRDLAYIFVPNACGTAGVFTQSAFSAPPLKVTKEALKRSPIKAVVINSGNANAGTGKIGYRDAKETAAHAAKLLGIKPYQVGVASTGIIGRPLPMSTLKNGLDKLLADPRQRSGATAAEAIMTTDLTRKEIFCRGKVAGETVTIAGFAKGSGMIAPNMATMLSAVTTDVNISSAMLKLALKEAVDVSFNAISVDGCMSTNDTVFLLANGASGVSPAPADFTKVLTRVCMDLARQLIADAEEIGNEHIARLLRDTRRRVDQELRSLADPESRAIAAAAKRNAWRSNHRRLRGAPRLRGCDRKPQEPRS
jgi:glutamate N-acetyltransferase/amino-acid N-acetyltransferase